MSGIAITVALFLSFLLTLHVVLLRIVRVCSRFWIASDYIYYGVRFIGVCTGAIFLSLGEAVSEHEAKVQGS